MIRHLQREQIDSTKWDHCVMQAHNTMVYSLSWCLDILADNWSALVWGDYELVMPLPFRKKYGFKYLYQPRFTQQYGVFSNQEITSDQVKSFIESIPDEYKYVDINLNRVCFTYQGKKHLISRNNFVVDLNFPYETIRKKYSFNCRMNVKRTERPEALSMKLAPVEDTQLVIDLFAEHQVKYSDRFTSSDYDKLKKFVDHGRKKNMIEIVGVYDQYEKVCAASIFVNYQNRKVSVFSGSNQLARKEKAMFFLFDRLIKKNAEKNLMLDFAGSNDPGLANFYSGFGSVNEPYPKLKYNRLPWPLNIIKK